LKQEDSFLKDIETSMRRHRYTTKTEFIREAIRDKIRDLEKEEALKEKQVIKSSMKSWRKGLNKVCWFFSFCLFLLCMLI